MRDYYDGLPGSYDAWKLATPPEYEDPDDAPEDELEDEPDEADITEHMSDEEYLRYVMEQPAKPVEVKYFTLLVRDDDSSPWHIEFGAYDRADVMAERDELGDHGHRISLMKVITTGDQQADIDAAIAKLNGK